MFLKQKCDGIIKARECANGSSCEQECVGRSKSVLNESSKMRSM